MSIEREIDVVLSLDRECVLLQFPLHSGDVKVSGIRSKRGFSYVEGEMETPAGNISVRGCTGELINEYFLLSFKGDILVGEKLTSIVPMRPVLEETLEHKSVGRPQERIFSVNESKEEIEHRKKSPNYIVDELMKEEWTRHHVVKGEITRIPVPKDTQKPRRAVLEYTAEDIGRLRRTIYNARVCRLEVLIRIFANIPENTVKKILSEMTVCKFDRYILKGKYFGDLLGKYNTLIDRLESEGDLVFVTLLPEETIDSDPQLIYLVKELFHKHGHIYVLKGDVH